MSEQTGKRPTGDMIPLGGSEPIRGRKPQDHLPPRAEQAVEFVFEGEKFTAPAGFFDDFEVMEQLEDGRLVPVLRGLLGRDQLERAKALIREAHDGRVPLTAFERLFEAVASADPTGGR